MLQTVVDEPFLEVLGRVRSAAASQGWLLTAGGSPQAPQVPMTFRRGFGSFQPAGGLVVELRSLDANRTEVDVTAWRGSTVVDGPDAQRMIRALGPSAHRP